MKETQDDKTIWESYVTNEASGAQNIYNIKKALGGQKLDRVFKAMLADPEMGPELENFLYTLGSDQGKIDTLKAQVQQGQQNYGKQAPNAGVVRDPTTGRFGAGNKSGVQFAPNDGTDPNTLPDSKGEVRGADGRFGKGNKSGVRYA